MKCDEMREVVEVDEETDIQVEYRRIYTMRIHARRKSTMLIRRMINGHHVRPPS